MLSSTVLISFKMVIHPDFKEDGVIFEQFTQVSYVRVNGLDYLFHTIVKNSVGTISTLNCRTNIMECDIFDFLILYQIRYHYDFCVVMPNTKVSLV